MGRLSEGHYFLEEILVNLVARVRDARSGDTHVDQFDADVTTRFTYETFHTSDRGWNRLLVVAATLHFQGSLH